MLEEDIIIWLLFLGGPDTPSIGFASGVDRLIHVLQEMGQEKKYLPL